MKLNWLFLSFLSFFLWASPAWAGKIVNWNFNRSQNRLTFTTDQSVQPKAQLISNPTRLLIDLPGTSLGRPTVNQAVGGKITSIRIGQFEANTTRVVIELAPGYTIDPNRIKIQGANPRQWSVELPTPERINLLPNTLPPNLPNPDPNLGDNNLPSSADSSPFFQVTDNGLFVNLDNQEPERITVRRSGDRRQIDFFVDGITLNPSLQNKSFAVNRYGVSTVEFTQASGRSPWGRITLKVEPDGPNWQATRANGGIVLLPEGGLGLFKQSNSNSSNTNNSPHSREILVESMELDNNGQLLIKTNNKAKAISNWNRDSGIYQIRIENAKIADNFSGPQLRENDPISVMRILEEDSNNVLILIQPARGVKIDNLDRPSNQLLSLQLTRSSDPLPELVSIPVPPPQNTTSPPPSTNNPPSRNSDRQGRLVVVIDPGHGGKDPGTIGIGGIQEKNIILPISQHLQQFLSQQGIQVVMTRDSDYFVSLEGRTQMANRMGADLFVSVHANALNLSRPDVNGLETYHYGSGSALASTIHRSVLQRMNIRDRGVRSARFYVLRNSKMPSVLVEVGFLTGREDSANLTNADYRRRMAEAIGYGILEYIKQNK